MALERGERRLVYTLENARSLIAVVLIILIAWLFSEKKGRFPFLLAIGALLVQAGFVLLLFAIPNSKAVLAGVSLPMLVRAFTYRTKGMETFVKKAVSGGCEGVLHVDAGPVYAPARNRDR